ncbi:hypothetical protein Xen7305DRAFT_00003790 [Xenococcus sp. PCC 7305]|nr:hypothetical protein Xen7305DRAFT_00003790 [Xenococcus sp. PCC 7305]
MIDLIYLDYNCFQRGFDDLSQTRMKMGALACQDVFTQAEKKQVTLIWSFMHQKPCFALFFKGICCFSYGKCLSS